MGGGPDGPGPPPAPPGSPPRLGLEVPGVERRITAGIGVAGHPLHAVDAATLLRKADRALYAAKEAGRDRVEVASAPAVAPAPA